MSKSLTSAKRSERVLLQFGIPARVVRPSQELSEKGCGYAVRIDRVFLGKAVTLLREHQLPVGRLYEQLSTGGYQETST